MALAIPLPSLSVPPPSRANQFSDSVPFRILLDVSRLLSRAERAVPTGIDRVEMAYARHLIATMPDRLSFAAVTSWGRAGPLPATVVIALINAMDRRWRGLGPVDPAFTRRILTLARWLRLRVNLSGERALFRRERRQGLPLIYLLVSHHHLDRRRLLSQLKERTGASFVCLIHDLIPMEFPEYVRPGIAGRHFQRMETAATLADAVITNSVHTAQAFGRMLKAMGRDIPVLAVPLGIDLGQQIPAVASAHPVRRPYFICVATIEPKKNHMLLLNVWRKLATEYGAAAPRLILVGQRGWEIENVIDMIERSTPLRGMVEEHSALPDSEMQPLLRNARALLMPSFAEGYGLPVAEALALGVPVICSDLDSLREVGGTVPEYLDPLDGPAWARMIMDYSGEESAARAAQMRRLSAWPAPTWSSHFDAVSTLLKSLSPRSPPDDRQGAEPSVPAKA